MPLALLLLAPVALALSTLDVSASHSLLGKRALLLSTALPLEREECLQVADLVLASGASVRLLVVTPSSGECSLAGDSLQYLQLMQRTGFPRLMESLGFAFGGVSGQYGSGNRQRVDFVHVRADDVESLSLELTDSHVLFVHTPAKPLAPALEKARFRLQRRAFSFVLRRLEAQKIALRRDELTPRLRWAWLAPVDAAPDEEVADESEYGE